MFDDEQVKSYKSIKAPDGLKEKIMSGNEYQKPQYGSLIRIVSVAAMIVLVIGASLHLTRKPQSQVAELSGQKIGTEGVRFTGIAMASLREMSVRIPIDFKLRGEKTKISVSYGSILADDELDGSNSIVTDQDMRLWWVMDTVESLSTYEMYVSSKKGNYIITLSSDDEGNLIIRKK